MACTLSTGQDTRHLAPTCGRGLTLARQVALRGSMSRSTLCSTEAGHRAASRASMVKVDICGRRQEALGTSWGWGSPEAVVAAQGIKQDSPVGALGLIPSIM